jgi:hypothetical protein
MPYKRQPSGAEIQALAEHFRELWRPADVMRPWLRKHADLFRTMVNDGWSWQGLADALKCAGITYQTGNGWRGVILKNEVARACKPLKSSALLPPRESENRTASVPHLISHRQSDDIPRNAATDDTTNAVSPPPTLPRFKPFSLKPHEPPRPLTPTEIEEREANRVRMFGQ